MDILQLTERIAKTIELGESQFREFKSCLHGEIDKKTAREPRLIAKDIAETLVAFANADGGELLVGVEDNGEITGFEFSDNTVQKLLNAPTDNIHHDTPLPSYISRKIHINGKDILYFSVEKSVTAVHQTADGRCLQRKDLENRPVAFARLQFERQEQLSREYDRQFVDGASVVDLNMDLVHRVSNAITSMSPEKCLQYLGLAEYGMGGLRLRRAALLLFAAKILDWHPRCQVRVVRVRGIELKTGRDYNVAMDEVATGNILELITSSWEKLRPHLVETKLTPDALFQERVMYPEDACREALINAITHRDYSIEGKNIEIYIFDNRMEVRSPGSLLSTIKIEELRKLSGVHESRNALVARVLRQIGYVREMGEGLRRIYRLMQDADLVSPEIYANSSEFSIVLNHKSVFSDEDQRWLDGFKPLKLSRDEMLIALLGKDGKLLSPRQVYERLGLIDWDIYREIIDQIQTKGILYTTMSQKQKVTASRKAKLSQRDIARLKVRQPEEIEVSLGELFKIIKINGETDIINSSYLGKIRAGLSKGNSFNFDTIHLGSLFRLLGLTDDEKKPTFLMQSIWVNSLPKAQEQKTQKEVMSANIRFVEKKEERPSQTPQISSNATVKQPKELYIGNLPYEITELKLKEFLSKFGTVVFLELPEDYFTGKSRGYAFFKMLTHEETVNVLENANDNTLNGRRIKVNYSNYGKL